MTRKEQINDRWPPARITLAAILAVAFALPVMAQQSRVYREGDYWVEEVSGTLPAAASLNIRLDFGDVKIQGGSQPNISYSMKKRVRAANEADARLQLERFRFAAGKNGDSVTMEGTAPGRSKYGCGTLSVWAPHSLQSLKAVTAGGNETLNDINGKVEARTGGGNVDLNDVFGSISTTTGGGNIHVGTASGELMLKTGGGSIHVENVKGSLTSSSGGGDISIGDATQAVSVQTGGGSIEVKKCGGALLAKTGGGSLDVGAVAGDATVQTGGGSIRLSSASGLVNAQTTGGAVELYGLSHGARVQTGSGELVAEFLGRDFSESSLQTPAGDVVIYLSPQLHATVRASVEVGDGYHINSDFPEIAVKTEGGHYGPRSVYAEGNLNGGGPVLRVRTSAGNIELRRAKK